MSLFLVTVPTRENELELRKKELVIQNAIHVSENNTPRSSIESISGPNSKLTYLATTGAAASNGQVDHVEIIVSDDFMEVKKHIPEASGSFSNMASSELLDDAKIQAEIEKFFLEKHLEDTLEVFGITGASWGVAFGGKMTQVEFTTSANITDVIIRRFQSVGIGSKYESSITVCSADVYYGPIKYVEDNKNKEEDDDPKQGTSAWSDFVQSIKARLTVAQVVGQIRSMTVLNFDFLAFVLVAALIACLGLLEDNSVILVASMLISPLMGPIMAFTFASVIRDFDLLKTGLKSEAIGLSMCLCTGFIVGMFMESEWFDGPWSWDIINNWPTKEMQSRGQPRSLIVGVLMAIPSGVGVALSVLAGNAGSLVGVAIAASLLPPAVNCGLFWGLACVIWLKVGAKQGKWNTGCHYNHTSVTRYYDKKYVPVNCENAIHEFSLLGILSFGLTCVNIIVIFVIAVLILKIKEVAPYTTRKSLRRFWKEDLAFTRKYNDAHAGQDMRAGIMNDLQHTSNLEEVKQNLDQDQVFRQINKRVLGGGGANAGALLNELKHGENTTGSDIELPRSRHLQKQARVSDTETKGGGWFSWIGGGKTESKTKHKRGSRGSKS